VMRCQDWRRADVLKAQYFEPYDLLVLAKLSLRRGLHLFPTIRQRNILHYRCLLQACSPISSQGGLFDPQMRASNEHLPSVRVPRAGGR
jgi:hypothetical protein